MAMWHCPHCGTPQAETARCWVCRRSSTTCSTCRHFRRAVTPGIGYCGLDRTRRPLGGNEIRGCWSGRPVVELDLNPSRPASVPSTRLRGFIPLDGAGVADAPVTAPGEAAPTSVVARPAIVDPLDRVTLFDLDP